MASRLSEAEHSSILPMVADTKPANWGMWAFFALLPLGGLWLFSALSSNRARMEAPATLAPPPAAEAGRITAAPPLALPQTYALGPRDNGFGAKVDVFASEPAPRPRNVLALSPRASTPDPQPYSFPTYAGMPAIGELTVSPPGPSVVFDSAFSRGNAASVVPAEGGDEGSRVTARRFANPSRTIPQGTVIPAVLETALDSTRPGPARALVQRDVYSFDGTRVLVQRGSRLFGTYESGLEAGQNRALIQWTRLIRPDGVTIALDSPSSDPLGRIGVKGRVDGKFLQRFGGAILQSVLDIGVGVATREASDGVIVALPGSTQNLRVNDQQNIQRTLKIRHGTSVSVFVARDLDFSTVE